MKNRLVHGFGSGAVLAILCLSASAAQAEGVQDSSPSPTTRDVASGTSDVIRFNDGKPLLGEKPLAGDAFYRLVERPDLAEHYRRRQERKTTALGTSIFVGSLGLLWGVGDAFYGRFSRKSLSPYPWLLVGAALTTSAVAALIPSDPIDFDDRVALARAYNNRVRLRPALHPGGGGLIVAGSF